MAPTCRICGRGLGQIVGYLQRVNEKGVPGAWECSPTCDADLPTETVLFMVVEGGDEQVGKAQVALAYDYMDEPVTESERAKVARKHQLPLRGEVKQVSTAPQPYKNADEGVYGPEYQGQNPVGEVKP